MTIPTAEDRALAALIVEHMRTRNGRELDEAFDNITVGSHRLMIDEIAHILAARGWPSNWMRPVSPRGR